MQCIKASKESNYSLKSGKVGKCAVPEKRLLASTFLELAMTAFFSDWISLARPAVKSFGASPTP